MFYREFRRATGVLLDQTEEIAVKAVEGLIADGIEKSMAEYNGIDLREDKGYRMRNYEIMFIVNPNTSGRRDRQDQSQIEGIITSGGGKVEKIEKMGKRRLAYEIDRKREGYYVLFVITANGDIFKECERRLRVMDAVIKYITVRTDEEIRRFEKIKSYRQKRAARRGSSQSPGTAVEELPEQVAEEAMQ